MPEPTPAIEQLAGPFIVGFLLNWGLFGTLSVQLYLYYLAFPNDRRLLRNLIYGIYIIESVQTILVAHDAFTMFGYDFGDIHALTRMNSFWFTVPIMSAVAAGVGQVFYAYRIFVLSESRIIPIFIICVSLTSSVAALITGIYSLQAGDLTKTNNRKTQITAGIWCGAAALCDILIAICMTYYLTRSAINFRRTRIRVTRIIRLTIETGSVTAAAALLSFILYVATPHQTFYITPGLLLPKLYANTVYMVLNSRIRIIGGRDTDMSSTDMSITTTVLKQFASQSTGGTQPADGMQGPAPVVEISSEVFSDTYEMGQMKVSKGASCGVSNLKFSPKDKSQDGCMILSA
ncbi:hypothetical protein EDD18DRAFT_1375580 [Armillaria luteobubalina]|uniref:DUF6534 domain-containing protein n=1 Tax=Armillaria luteobubalina TaxID=153913 RepID=A0AA39Q9Z1_9AGAR|nr:hypothetical protein EDD18DRAFT_1375580 [Armillaria luteobubalina]